jgi:hypothetical protein
MEGAVLRITPAPGEREKEAGLSAGTEMITAHQERRGVLFRDQCHGPKRGTNVQHDRSHIDNQSSLTTLIYRELLPALKIESLSPHDPVVVHQAPTRWHVLGRGNYAAVLYHPEYPEVVVKVYAPGRPGFEAEREVYHRLGEHPAYSQCMYAEDGFLVLKRLHGVTLYDAVHQGLPIPEQVIQDIDRALGYARQRDLHPHDVHGRNVMMQAGRGLVVDVSDFLKEEDCTKWKDLKKGYQRVYRPIFMPLRLPVPYFVLDLVRLGYRVFRRLSPDRSRVAAAVNRGAPA